MKEVIQILNKNKNCSVLVFDEIDKAEDFNFLYTFLEQIYRKSIILITNYKENLLKMDERIKSRLVPETIEFREYNYDETHGILKQRCDLTFAPSVWDSAAFKKIADKTFELKDIRKGLYLLKEAANISEQKSKRCISIEEVDSALSKLDSFSSKKMDLVSDDEKQILELIKSNNNSKIGDLHKKFVDAGNDLTYKTFQRKIEKLEKNKFIEGIKTLGGNEGNTTIIKYVKDKTLNEY